MVPYLRAALLFPLLALLMVGCGDDDDAGSDGGTTTTTTTTTTTAAPDTTLPGGDLVACESPAGYVVDRPADWETNAGDVVAPCRQFDPEPFDVPAGTDERVAAITIYIDPVPFAEVAAPDDRDADRAVTTIDGLQAVRLEYEARDDAFWPEGTPITLYAVDLGSGDGNGSEPRTLFLDTVGIGDFDYDTNQVVLDRMARTVDITLDGVATDERVVARYEGATGFRVEGEVTGAEACLRIPPDGDQVCTDVPRHGELFTIQLRDLEPVLAGVTGDDVFRVAADPVQGPSSTVLPAPIGDSDVRGFAFTFDVDALERLTLYDIAGEELDVIQSGG